MHTRYTLTCSRKPSDDQALLALFVQPLRTLWKVDFVIGFGQSDRIALLRLAPLSTSLRP